MSEPSAKKNILVIDDDRDLTRSIQAFLGGRGYTVTVAHNGTEGMAAIEAGQPDLIVLDIMMDYDAEGFNLAYKLKENPPTRKIPIVIFSGFPKELDKKLETFEFILGRDWPAAAMLEKPADLKELARVVANVLAEKPYEVA